jgi:hypothetical protein
MKSRGSRRTGLSTSGLGQPGTGVRERANIPMEWMDLMSWRLPSGKALAEFWLQSGFLAPSMLGPLERKKVDRPGRTRETR